MRRRVLHRLKEDLPFIIEVKTDNAGSSASNQFTIPTSGAGYNYRIKTNDGHNISGITGNHTLTFSSAGTYEISIYGSFPRIYFNNTGDRLKLLDIKQWGEIVWYSFAFAYYGCSNMTMSAIDSPNLSNVTSFDNSFRAASSFNGDISSWDVSNVTNMNGAFRNASSFNQNIGSWNVSNVTNMVFMFNSAGSFNGDISSWNVSNVTNMAGMFNSAGSFNANIGSWDVSSVTSMANMFRNASSFNQNIGSWDVSSVTNITDFMWLKTAANYSATNLDAIYNGWSLLTLQPNLNINFNTIKYTAAGSAGKAILQGSPNNWTITDGGI